MNPPVKPQPTWLLTISSILVIAGCVVMAAACFALFYTLEPWAMIAGGIVSIFPIAIGAQQYRGTFRNNRDAAKILAAVFVFLGGMICLSFLFHGISLLNGDLLVTKKRIAASLILLFEGAALVLVALFNYRWSNHLKSVFSTDPESERRTFTLKELFSVMTLIAIMIPLSAMIYRSEAPETVEHVTRAQCPYWGLPENATDICYFQGFRAPKIFEFTTDEQSFKDWIQRETGLQTLPSLEIKEPQMIWRYNRNSTNNINPDRITVSYGLEYYWSYEDQVERFIFDRASNRAYYYAH